MTNTAGSTVAAKFTNACPRYAPNSSVISKAAASPAFAASNTSFAVISFPVKILFFVFFSKYLLARRTSPVAEAYCSRHPFLPHPQASVSSSLTVICPISPPDP